MSEHIRTPYDESIEAAVLPEWRSSLLKLREGYRRAMRDTAAEREAVQELLTAIDEGDWGMNTPTLVDTSQGSLSLVVGEAARDCQPEEQPLVVE